MANKTLTEMVKSKKDKIGFINKAQERLYNEATQLLADYKETPSVAFSKTDDNLIETPYVDSTIKKRAQTIGLAYNIATKLRLSHLDTSKVGYPQRLKRELSDEDFLREVLLEFTVTDNTDHNNRFQHVLSELDKLAKDCGGGNQSNGKMSDLAVSLAWYLTKKKTNFFPADKEVMLTSSETHTKLVNEVKTLLDNSFAETPFDNKVLDFMYVDSLVIEPTLSDSESELVEKVDFLVETRHQTILVDLKTTENLPKVGQHDFSNLISFGVLNNKLKQYERLSYQIIYPRFGLSVEYLK